MANYEVLEPGGHAALIDGLKDYTDREGGVCAEQIADGSVNLDKLGDDVLDELDSKAYADGYYAQLTAGAADNLTGRGDTTAAEFLYRTAGGTADIETGQAVAKSIKGNTLVWNQWRKPTDGTASGTLNGVTYTRNSDGSVSIGGTASALVNIYPRLFDAGELTIGHKYLIKGCCPAGGSGNTYYGGVGGLTQDMGNGYIWTNASISTDASQLRIVVKEGATIPQSTLWPQFFDLTQMFGAGNEPSTVAEFEALYPLPYYEYDAGSLLSVNMTGIETTGFNQWDEQTAEGIWNDNGTMTGSSAYICCKNKIPVFPGQTYYIQSPAAVTNVYMKGYDADGINGISLNLPGTNLLAIPDGVYFITFAVQKSQYGTTYNHDICINLSWSGRRNGEYEPFWSSQREIAASTYFPDGMRSAGSVYDELTSTEAIQRVGVVDLGTLTWIKDSASYEFRARRADNPSIPMWVGSAGSVKSNCICSKFTTLSPNDTYHGANVGISLSGDSYISVGADSTYADAAAFKVAMSGVMLHYALATPIVTPIDPALNLSYRVDDFGTERVMVPEDERSAPPVLDIAYGLNVVDFVRRAPTEYISHASMSQFRLALMAHLGVFINETWDEVDNRYEYTITSE